MNVGANRQIAAELGARYIDNTYGKIFGDFCFITAVSAATLTVSGSNITDATSVTLAQGQTIRGRYTELTVSSGAIICYNSRGEFTRGAYTTSTFPADDTLDWAQFGNGISPPVLIPSGTNATSTLGKTINITSIRSEGFTTGDSYLVRQSYLDTSTGQYVDNTWRGGMDSDTVCIMSSVNKQINLTFPSDIRGVGFQVQQSTFGVGYINAKLKNSSGNPINTQFAYGDTQGQVKIGTAAFVGFESSVQNIRSVEITCSSIRVPATLVNTIRNYNFAVGKIYIKT